jgi:hypothetical protein
MRYAFVLLMVLGLTNALSTPARDPGAVVLSQITFAMQILVALMATMIALAAAVYVIGQLFGSETRARANVWSQSMLVAVGISALIIAILYFLVPALLTGGVPSVDVVDVIEDLKEMAEMALVGLIALLLVLSAGAYVIGQFFGSETRARASVWATGLLSGAIVSAVIYVLLFQVLTQFQATLFQGTPLFIYRSVIVNISFFAAFLILITFLLSKVFKVPEWEAYLNIELSNLMATFLLVMFMIGVFGVGTAVASIYSQGTATSPPQAAISYMRSVVADSVLRAIFDVYQIQACTSILTSITRRIGEFVLTQAFKVFPGLDTFISITNVLGFGLVSVYGSISAQIALLYLVDSTMINFFLPAGLILRFFPPTRDAGAFLISVAFGFQIVFPTTYMINKTIYEEIGGEPYKSPYVLISSLCGPFKYGVWGVLLNPSANPVFRLVPGGTIIGTFLSRIVSETLLNAVSMAEFIPIMQHIASLSLLALFMPALSMMITIAFINAMTKFIVAKV